MFLEPYIKKEGSLTLEEKMLSIDKKFWNCLKLNEPLSK
jgi:hypothetical protein